MYTVVPRGDGSMKESKEQEISLMAHLYNGCSQMLDEAQRRRMLGEMVLKADCRGAIAMLTKLTGVCFYTIKRGIEEVLSGVESTGCSIRLSGGGRKKIEDKQPEVLNYVKSILDEATYGSPESGRKWTSLSHQDIADELQKRHGIRVCANTAGRLIEVLGYSKQANKKMDQVGEPHPDRDAQFQYLNKTVDEFLKCGEPVISVDTKKKENIGNFKNNGQEYRQSKDPRVVLDHDFPIPELGKIAPYGIYTLNDNTGFVNLGISADTSEFAVESIRRWWRVIGSTRFPKAKRILINADCGGSNRANGRLWRMELAKLSEEIGLELHIVHVPPGASKWNKVEHRLFCYITKNWQGKPLVDVQCVINLINSTSTNSGLSVLCVPDWNEYAKGLKVSDDELNKIDIDYVGPHMGWSYIIRGFRK